MPINKQNFYQKEKIKNKKSLKFEIQFFFFFTFLLILNTFIQIMLVDQIIKFFISKIIKRLTIYKKKVSVLLLV